ncbi:CLUMA_CG010135, isoform A [Clunio marinus]|uniref:CLUMA_CG010135, isoform A n=1 Tax=Clunio marinus TaxID=568069 RepID=A0A1J1IEC0_9DIPT|nr:CLUMA_CG010135, isoform A [Clunio marinus]
MMMIIITIGTKSMNYRGLSFKTAGELSEVVVVMQLLVTGIIMKTNGIKSNKKENSFVAQQKNSAIIIKTSR